MKTSLQATQATQATGLQLSISTEYGPRFWFGYSINLFLVFHRSNIAGAILKRSHCCWLLFPEGFGFHTTHCSVQSTLWKAHSRGEDQDQWVGISRQIPKNQFFQVRNLTKQTRLRHREPVCLSDQIPRSRSRVRVQVLKIELLCFPYEFFVEKIALSYGLGQMAWVIWLGSPGQ